MAEKEPTTKEDEVTVTTMTKVLTALGFAKPTPKANERGEDPNDPRLMIADLISSDASPFCPDDQMALQMLTYDTLVDMRDHFVLGQPIDLEPDTNNSKGGPPVAEKDPKTNAVTMSQTELDTLVTNAVAKALADNKPTLSAEDTAALEGAKKIVAANHEKLVTQITANSKMTKEQLAGMSDAQLEVIANGLTPAVVVAEPVADFGGRAVPLNTNADETDPAIEAMVPPDPKAALIAHRKGLN